jgi:predicted ester cyclase
MFKSFQCKKKGGVPMLTEENKDIVRRAIEEIWNKGNMAIADELLAANFVNHDPCGTPETFNLEAYKQGVSDSRTDFPDLHVTIEEQIAEGDKVVTRWTCTGTHKGKSGAIDIAPTGKQVTIEGVTIDHIAGGKILEEWWFRELMVMKLGYKIVPPSK